MKTIKVTNIVWDKGWAESRGINISTLPTEKVLSGDIEPGEVDEWLEAIYGTWAASFDTKVIS